MDCNSHCYNFDPTSIQIPLVIKRTMSKLQLLDILGLVLNTIAAVVLIIPNLNPTKKLSDDLVVSGKPGGNEYTQVKHRKESRINKVGLILLALGFIFQIIAMLV